MYVCTYLCMYLCMYVCMYVWMDGCMDACMHVCVYIYIYVKLSCIICILLYMVTAPPRTLILMIWELTTLYIYNTPQWMAIFNGINMDKLCLKHVWAKPHICKYPNNTPRQYSYVYIYSFHLRRNENQWNLFGSAFLLRFPLWSQSSQIHLFPCQTYILGADIDQIVSPTKMNFTEYIT